MPPTSAYDDPPVWSAAALAQEEGMKRLLDEHIRGMDKCQELVVVLDLPPMRGRRRWWLKAHSHQPTRRAGMRETQS
jgi:hypothetical protein